MRYEVVMPAQPLAPSARGRQNTDSMCALCNAKAAQRIEIQAQDHAGQCQQHPEERQVAPGPATSRFFHGASSPVAEQRRTLGFAAAIRARRAAVLQSIGAREVR